MRYVRGIVALGLEDLFAKALHMRRSHGEVWRRNRLPHRDHLALLSWRWDFHDPSNFFSLVGAADCGGRTEDPRKLGVVPPLAGAVEATGDCAGVMTWVADGVAGR